MVLSSQSVISMKKMSLDVSCISLNCDFFWVIRTLFSWTAKLIILVISNIIIKDLKLSSSRS